MSKFIKVTKLQGGTHVYLPADKMEYISPTQEGVEIWIGEDRYTVRDDIADILDQIEGRVYKLPTNDRPSTKKPVVPQPTPGRMGGGR